MANMIIIRNDNKDTNDSIKELIKLLLNNDYEVKIKVFKSKDSDIEEFELKYTKIKQDEKLNLAIDGRRISEEEARNIYSTFELQEE